MAKESGVTCRGCNLIVVPSRMQHINTRVGNARRYVPRCPYCVAKILETDQFAIVREPVKQWDIAITGD